VVVGVVVVGVVVVGVVVVGVVVVGVVVVGVVVVGVVVVGVVVVGVVVVVVVVVGGRRFLVRGVVDRSAVAPEDFVALLVARLGLWCTPLPLRAVWEGVASAPRTND
jgi:hypothetical protein